MSSPRSSSRRIDRIYVSGYRHDLRFAKASVASIRHWYPDLPITLIKDRFFGEYSTRQIERWWNCDILDVGDRVFGWGFGKLEPLFQDKRARFLVLDADILMLGRVIEELEAVDSDFVVQHEPDPPADFIGSHYYDLALLQGLDPQFSFPGFTFNTGQWVGESGFISRDEIQEWVTPTIPPQVRRPDVFKLGEQGLLNYLLVRGAKLGRWKLEPKRFMAVGSDVAVQEIDVEKLEAGKRYPIVAHWCGCRNLDFSKMVRGDLWEFFEREFYSKSRLGTNRLRLDQLLAAAEGRLRSTAKRLLRR